MGKLTAKQLRKILESLSDEELTKASPLPRVPNTGLDKYCPHEPFPKQRQFIDLDCYEAFFGGAAGPGKSDALLMAALKYVHVPGYAALILRKSFARLRLPDAIMSRCQGWINGTDARFNKQSHCVTFPSGAKIQFGYIANPESRLQYQSAAFQFIGFDELTEFALPDTDDNPYLWMMSRCRRTKCDIHFNTDPDKNCAKCREVGALQRVPLRIRSASNPGGPGHDFVKTRFVTDEAIQAIRDGESRTFWVEDIRTKKKRAFLPARMQDNPALDSESYIEGMMNLPMVTRERLINGDWSIIPDGVLRQEWIREFDRRGDMLIALRPDGTSVAAATIHEDRCRRVAFIDTAGTDKDVAREARGRQPSWSVCEVWDYWPDKKLMFLRHVWRSRTGWDGLKAGILATLDDWNVRKTVIEDMHWGIPLKNELPSRFGPELVSPGGESKLARSTDLQNKLEKGEVLLPADNLSWRMALEAEWIAWTGHPEEQADQIDTASYAARYFSRKSASWGGQVAGTTSRGYASSL